MATLIQRLLPQRAAAIGFGRPVRFCLLPSIAQSQQLPQNEVAAISAIHSLLPPNESGELIASLGYKPNIPDQAWNAFPAVRVGGGLVAADQQKPGTGKLFLAQITRRLAQKSERVQYHPALAPLLAEFPAGGQIKFAQITPTPSEVRLPRNIIDSINAIAMYADGGALHGSHGILNFSLGLAPDTAYEILRSVPTVQDALVKGLIAAGVPRYVRRIADLAIQLQRESERED